MSRFFVERDAVDGAFIHITDRNDIKHIAKVLRLLPGDELEISDAAAFEYKTEIRQIEADRITLKILDKQKFSREPELRVTLYQGIPKQGKMETIIQKAVELGVYKIVPVFMERTVVTDKGNFGKKIDRWQKISDEAVKQCRRGICPEIEGPVSFEQMLSRLREYDRVLIPYENEENVTLKDVLRTYDSKPESLAVIIGPEGGFADQEAEKAKKAGCSAVTLGKTILRTETAGIAALAMIMYELEL